VRYLAGACAIAAFIGFHGKKSIKYSFWLGSTFNNYRHLLLKFNAERRGMKLKWLINVFQTSRAVIFTCERLINRVLREVTPVILFPPVFVSGGLQLAKSTRFFCFSCLTKPNLTQTKIGRRFIGVARASWCGISIPGSPGCDGQEERPGCLKTVCFFLAMYP
jgi:hypothetical protein